MWIGVRIKRNKKYEEVCRYVTFFLLEGVVPR